MSRTVAIIGAGPSGLAAACACLRRKVVPLVLEAETPGASLERFGPTRFFTPLKTSLPVDVIAFAGGTPDLDAILTGPEPTVTPQDLASGEPRFHMVGAKSYGRAPAFLLQTGFAQIDTILDRMFEAE